MRIIFFNHKGGVSKTTTTFHLGWKLAERNHKVLLVDADPQCNLSGLIMQSEFEKYYTEDATKNKNLMDGVNSAFEGRPEPIKGFECFEVENNSNLFLLPGHPNLTELEPSLSFSQTTNNAFATMQNLPGSFNALIEKCCDKHNIEYVLIDLNPGLSAINQNFFTISDLFIVPTNPDPFSLMAVKTLSEVLPRWYLASQQMRDTFANSSYPFPSSNPKFGGVVIQRFNIRSGRPSAPYRDNMDEILEAVKTDLAPRLDSNKMLLNNDLYVQNDIADDYCLAEIPDFQSLLPQSHKFGVPVFALTNNQIERVGAVLERMALRRDEFNDMFEDFALKIELIKQNA